MPPMKKFPLQLKSSGFTLLELMITITVLAILLGIGVPSYQDAIRQNRLATTTNDLLASVAVARSEAVKRGTLVTICPANNNQTDCAVNDQWSNGWIVFADAKGTVGRVNIGGAGVDDLIIQRSPPATAAKVTITNPGVNQLSYRGDGGANMPPATTMLFVLVPQGCVNPNGARRVLVNTAGRAIATRVNCS